MTTKTNKRTRAEAKKLMWEYYRDNKEVLPTWIRECREEIISALVTGLDPSETFARILETVDPDTPLKKSA